jgi:hypothetical protein
MIWTRRNTAASLDRPGGKTFAAEMTPISGSSLELFVGMRRLKRVPWATSDRLSAAFIAALFSISARLRAKDIHAAVEALVGEPVPRSSVKGALASNVAGSSGRLVRVARGRYVLAESAAPGFRALP